MSQSSQSVPERQSSAPVFQVGAPMIRPSAPVTASLSASAILTASTPEASARYPASVSVFPVEVEKKILTALRAVDVGAWFTTGAKALVEAKKAAARIVRENILL